MRRRSVGVVLLALSGIVGCAIQPDSAPRDIPDDQREQLDQSGPGAGQATGAGRVFLVVAEEDGRTRLRSVLRNASDGQPLFEALLDGPNVGELNAGLASALPPELSLNSARLTGLTMNVDVSDDILELGGNELRLAVAQIVFTASEIDGVRTVRIRVDGANREWPNGRGELLPDSLSIYDFPGAVESSQPSFPPVPSDVTV